MQENARSDSLMLNGEWDFLLGGRSGSIRVPGVWEMQGWPEDREGPAEYRKRFSVPASWQGKRTRLAFDAVSYYAEVSVNGQFMGAHEGLWTPFVFDVTDAIRPGEANVIAVRVTKPGHERFHFRDVMVGFIPYISMTFGGIWGDVRLSADSGAGFEDVRVLADSESVSLQAVPTGAGKCLIDIRGPDGQALAAYEQEAREGQPMMCQFDRPKGARCWSPGSVALYEAVFRLERGGDAVAEARRRFGFRALDATGDQLLLNGEPFGVRGLLSWGWWPETLAPIPDDAAIRDEFRRAREMGFNMIKLCLFVPPERYFDLADEEGMLLWLELPLWYQRANPHLLEQIPIEYADIFDRVHHHPSIITYSLGCELDSDVGSADLLGTLNEMARRCTRGALVCDNSGSGEAYGGLRYDFADFNDYHFYCDLHEFGPLVDHFRRDWRTPRPWIFGEFCDKDDYGDVGAISDACGGRPWWRDLTGINNRPDQIGYHDQEWRMAANDLAWEDAELVRISRAESGLARKFILEAVRSRAGMGGYVITGLRDTPISTSGIFDDLNKPKYPPEWFRTFNAESVLALDVGRARIWQRGGDRPHPIDRFNLTAGDEAAYYLIFSGHGFAGAAVRWTLRAESGEMAAGSWDVEGAVPAYEPVTTGAIRFAAPHVESAEQMTLSVTLQTESGQKIANAWAIWVYPVVESWPGGIGIYDPGGVLVGLDDLAEAAASIPAGGSFEECRIVIVGAFTPEVGDYVRGGGRVILIQQEGGALPVKGCPFWRESIKLIEAHPITDAIPHRGFTDLQFYGIAADHTFDSGALAEVLPGYAPLIRRLDARAFWLGEYLIDAEMGAGHLLATTLRVMGGLGDQPRGIRANIAGRHLLHALIAYSLKCQQ
jgi:hypothetical protein